MTTLVFAPGETGYPAALAGIKDPPRNLYVRGRLGPLAGPWIAVVGTRKASEAGRRAAFAIGHRLAMLGFGVASGLAEGIDGEAHGGVLSVGGLTVAVLAHGLHMVYPAAHRTLAADILASGGALASEHPDGAPPNRGAFVRRNRVISGLSEALVMVESDVDGGAMHAARFAHAQGRRLLVVLPADESKPYQRAGGEKLAAEMGAQVIRRPSDLDVVLGEPSAREVGT